MIGFICVFELLARRVMDCAGVCIIGIMHKTNIVTRKAERQLVVGEM